MPRIPQASFDTNISTRVGTPSSGGQLPQGEQRLTGAVASLTGVMGQLQEQSERTEAFSVATQARRDISMAKIRYEEALKNARGDGSFAMPDPEDSNTAPAKRRMIEGNVQDEYKRLYEMRNEAFKKAENVTRSDIAKELLGQYIDDDLIKLKMRENNYLNKVREKETREGLSEGGTLRVLELTTGLSDESVSPQTAAMRVDATIGTMRRELAQARTVIGDQGTKDLQKMHDSLYRQSASEIIKNTGLTQTSVAAADRLLSGISDPRMRTLAQMDLERTKKAVATVKPLENIGKAQALMAKLDESAVIDPVRALEIKKAADSLRSTYLDPKYSDVKQEQIDSVYSQMLAKVAAKEVTKQMFMDGSLRTAFEPAPEGGDSGAVFDPAAQTDMNPQSPVPMELGGGRSPSAQPGMLAEQEIRERASQALDLFAKDVPESSRAQIIEDAVGQTRAQWGTMRQNIPEMVDAIYPKASLAERIAYIEEAAKKNSAGNEVDYVTKKQASTFQQGFKATIAQNPQQAAEYLDSMIASAGGTETGETAHARKLAMGLVRTDKELSYLVAAADMSPARRMEAVVNARSYKDNLVAAGVTGSQMSKIYADKRIDAIGRLPPALRDGITSVVMHEAAAIAVRENTSPSSAMSTAIENLQKDFVFVHDDRNTVILRNGDGKVYEPGLVKNGVASAVKLADMSTAEKIAILRQYGKDGAVTDRTSPDIVDSLISKMIVLEPDTYRPNIVRAKLQTQNGVSIDLLKKKEDGQAYPVYYTAEQLMEMGKKNPKYQGITGNSR